MQRFVFDIYDPPAYGNCGFHAVAKLLSLEDSRYAQDGWFRVRQDLLAHLGANEAHYKTAFGETDFAKIRHQLDIPLDARKVTRDHWLSKLDHGLLMANTYRRPIIFHSRNSFSHTFLPDLCPFNPAGPPSLSLLYLPRNTHWVAVQMLPALYPMPKPDVSWMQRKEKRKGTTLGDWAVTWLEAFQPQFDAMRRR